jgi:hypothetical protein
MLDRSQDVPALCTAGPDADAPERIAASMRLQFGAARDHVRAFKEGLSALGKAPANALADQPRERG